MAILMYSHTRSGSPANGTKAWAMAEEKAWVNQNMPVTNERIFFGAFVYAYCKVEDSKSAHASNAHHTL